MIRFLFIVFVALAGFVSAALWVVREGDASPDVAEMALAPLESPAAEREPPVPAPAEIPPAEDEAPVEVQDLQPRGAFAPDGDAASGGPVTPRFEVVADDPAVAGAPVAARAAAAADFDDSALLIRRMLTVYRRAEERR